MEGVAPSEGAVGDGAAWWCSRRGEERCRRCNGEYEEPGLRDMDVDQDHGLRNTHLLSLAPASPANHPAPPGPPQHPPRRENPVAHSTVYVDVPRVPKVEPAATSAPPDKGPTRKPSAGKKRKQPDDTEPRPEAESKRPKMVDTPERENLVKCERCARMNIPCVPRKPGKPSAHQKQTTACEGCAKLKQGCKFGPFDGARKDEVRVKLPKPEKPRSKRATRVKKSASDVETSADERTEDVKPQTAKVRPRASVDRDRPHSGRPLSKAIEKANAALEQLPRLSTGGKLSGKRVTFGMPEIYKNLSNAAMQGTIRVEEEDRMEREAEERKMQLNPQRDDSTEQVNQTGEPRLAQTEQGRATEEMEQAQKSPQAEHGQEKDETEQESAMRSGDDEELVQRTDEYHRREAVQQFGPNSGLSGKRGPVSIFFYYPN